MLERQRKNPKKQQEKNDSVVLRISVRLTDFCYWKQRRPEAELWMAYSKSWKKKKKRRQPRILYPAKMSLRNEGKIKIFSVEKVSEKKPQRIGGQQTHLTENIKGLLWAESKWPQMILQIHMRKTESAKLYNYMRPRKCIYLSFLNWLLKTSF